MSPERNVDIRHVSRENIRRDPRPLIFAEQFCCGLSTPFEIPKKYTHFAQNGHKQIKRLKTDPGRTKRDGAGALAHDPSDRVNNGGIYGILAYD
jgi:hypothetical protein